MSEDKVEELFQAAKEVVLEYYSHGGEDTHQTCLEGCGCAMPKEMRRLQEAVFAIAGGRPSFRATLPIRDTE